MALIPEDRLEQILAGENIAPETREEAFLMEAVQRGGGSSLPDMTGNSGKFLTTNGTVASWGDLPKDSLVVELQENGETWSIVGGITPSDIIEAFNAKKLVYIYIGGTDSVVPVVSADEDDVSITAGVSLVTEGVINTIYAVYDDGAWNVSIESDTYKPYVLSGTYAESGGTKTVTIANVSKLAEAYAAAEDGRAVYLEYADDGETYRYDLLSRKETAGQTEGEKEYKLVFSVCYAQGNLLVISTVRFENSATGSLTVASASDNV